MRCEVDGAPPCRRCRQTDSACVFKPRANAAAVHEVPEPAQSGTFYASHVQDPRSILSRLDRIEAVLGIGKNKPATTSLNFDSDSEQESEGVSFHGLWKAVRRLRTITQPPQPDDIWSHSIVKTLWRSFFENLPLLHFLSDQRAFASPTPLLLASILYISALHHPSAEFASLATGYFAATCSAISELSTPLLIPNPSDSKAKKAEHGLSASPNEQKHFHNILGLIMASLSSEGYIETTGTWIAIAYRLLLDHCRADTDDATRDWRGLFSGLQVIDVEHASMHLCYPLLPSQPPSPALQHMNSYQGNAFRGLAQMMHQGLSHFVGRGLPTIWSFLSTIESDFAPTGHTPFTEHDSQVMRLWAKGLDNWLIRYNGASQPSPSDRQGILILLQYHLHKLYVLSIYHPARGFDLGTANISSVERQELLVSARAVLRLRQDEASIWSNWDLVMITWAAILLLRGVEDGLTRQDDLLLIQAHLNSLGRNPQPAQSIHSILSTRLESAIQSIHTPPATGPDFAFPSPRADYSWTIFDQEIMSLANPPWLFEDILPQTAEQVGELSRPSRSQSGFPGHYDAASGSGSGSGSGLLMEADSHDFDTSRHWPAPDVWPSTLNRLFGRDTPMEGNNSGPT